MSSESIRRLAAQIKTAGGSDFSVFMRGTNVRQLFSEAKSNAEHEYGQGGYTGTIAEAYSYTLSRRGEMTMDEAGAYLDEWMDGSTKGDTLAIPVMESKMLGRVKDVTLKVKARDQNEAVEKAKTKARTLVTVRSGAKFIVTITNSPKKLRTGAPPEVRKQKAMARGVIFVPRVRNGMAGAQVVYANKVKANKAMKDFISDPDNYRRNNEFTMWKVEALEHLSIKGVGGTSTWEVGVQYKQVKPGKVVGYLFGGVYSS